VTKWIGKLGSGISKMWIIFAPPPGDRSRDTAHAQWPFQVMVMWSDWVTHNSGTDKRRKLRISKYVWRVKLFIPQTPPRSKGRRSRSQGQMKIGHKTWNICRKRHRIVEYTRLIGNRCRRSEWRGPIFDRKFLNSRFCTCAVKICLKVS